MSPDEIKIARSFSRITFAPATFNKRFALNMNSLAETNPDQEITEKQREWMYRILYTFRRQVPDIYRQFENHEYCRKIKRP